LAQPPCSMSLIRAAVFFSILTNASLAHGATIAETLGDASIGHDADTWTIAAGAATLTIASGGSRDFQIVSFVSPSGRSWTPFASADTVVTVNGTLRAFGSRAAGFRYESVATSNDGHVLRFDATYALAASDLRLTR